MSMMMTGLSTNETLRFIDLRSCKITDVGAEALTSTLGNDNTTVCTIRLNDNLISDKCGRNMATLLSPNTYISTFSVSGNQINHNTQLAIKAVCDRNVKNSKDAEIAPLLREVERLIGIQEKLSLAEQELSALVAKRQEVQRETQRIESKIAMTKSDEVLKVSHINKQVEQQRKQYELVHEKVQEREDEYNKMEAEYEERIKEVSTTLGMHIHDLITK